MTNSGVHEKGTFNAQDAIDNIKKDPGYHKAGAIALFIGVVRGETLDSEKDKVEKLTIEDIEPSSRKYPYINFEPEREAGNDLLSINSLLKKVDNDGSFKYSKVEAAEVSIPKDFSVSQNYPNPFNPTTKIDYQVPVDAKVVMEVYNITGQKVMDLVNQEMSAGYYTVNFGSSNLPSGVYIYRLAASDLATGKNFSSIKKMMLLK